MNRGRNSSCSGTPPNTARIAITTSMNAEHEDQPDDPDSLTLERGLLKRRKRDIDQGLGLGAARLGRFVT